MSKFKVGDRVRCIEGMVISIPSVELIWGDIYTVKKLTFGAVVFVELEERTSSYFATRFELVKEEMPLPPMWRYMTEEERKPIADAVVRGEKIQHYHPSLRRWTTIVAVGVPDFIYRIKPEEAIPDSFDWSHATFNYVARDEDGKAWGHERAPDKGLRPWWSSKGRFHSMDAFASYKQGNLPWDQSLICRPGFEVKNG